MIQHLTDVALTKWHTTSDVFMLNNTAISLEEQQKNEAAIDSFSNDLSSLVKAIPKRLPNRKKWKSKIMDLTSELEAKISPTENKLDYFLNLGYGEVTTAFIKQVRQFDPQMDMYDTFQAIRNVWIMNSIQLLFGMEVKLTPSIFAYSMMCPYSDNYLDDPSRTLSEKKQFNQRFKNWLMGEKARPANPLEDKLFRLVHMIEKEFDRTENPAVYEGLLAIHKAQEESLLQQRGAVSEEVLAISFDKGGASVLADAYLVRGTLTEKEAEFFFNYGVLLQLIDDLQDIEEDLQAQHQTIFTQADDSFDLDALTNQLMNFIQNFRDQDTCFTSEQGTELKEVICTSALGMLDEAIAQNHQRYSKEYYQVRDKESMIRFAYLADLRKTFMKTFSSGDLEKIVKILSVP